MSEALKNLPGEFLQRLEQIVPLSLWSSVTQGLTGTRLTTFRVNTLKATEDRVLQELENSGLICEQVQTLPLAYVLKKGSFKELTESKPYQEGWIYVQSLSSQIPAVVLAPKPGELILDLAAAPGGKTTQMAALMQNQGRIVALEPDPIRCERLKYNVEKQGASCVEVLRIPGEKLPDEWNGRFDRVLLDAPCSSEGTFCATDKESFSHWSLDFVRKISKVQKRLIEIAVRAVKPGGIIVYSTCSLSPEENEDLLNWTLLNFENLKLKKIERKMPIFKPALKTWKDKNYPMPLSEAKRIYPDREWEGFFVSQLLKRS